MAEFNQVVVHFDDGKVLKGRTNDFQPNRQIFHLFSTDGTRPVPIRFDLLKAVFFVEDLRGNPSRSDLPRFLSGAAETAKGKKIAVRFKDGELLCGYTLTYTPGKKGFFVVPADPRSNNKRIYVLASATSEIYSGPAADDLVRKLLPNRKAV